MVKPGVYIARPAQTRLQHSWVIACYGLLDQVHEIFNSRRGVIGGAIVPL